MQTKIHRSTGKFHFWKLALKELVEFASKCIKFFTISDLNKTATPSSMGGTTSRMTTSSQIEQTVPHYMDMMKHMFAIAYIWAFGGSLHDR